MARPTLEGDTGVGEGVSPTSPEDCYREFQRDSQAFEALLPTLLTTRPTRFVAIYKGELIDEDEDEFALARRMEDLHRSEFVLIRRVCEDGEPEDLMQSPEVVSQ